MFAATSLSDKVIQGSKPALCTKTFTRQGKFKTEYVSINQQLQLYSASPASITSKMQAGRCVCGKLQTLISALEITRAHPPTALLHTEEIFDLLLRGFLSPFVSADITPIARDP